MSLKIISYSFPLPENLDLAEDPKMINHPEVGKYFEEYKLTHFVPNAEKLAQYPQDMPVTLRICRDKYGDKLP